MIRPTRKETNVAQISSGGRVWFPIVIMLAPRMIGIESRKENFRAVFSFRPVRRPAEIVEPEREIPGKRARIWARPMRREFFLVSFEGLMFRLREAIIRKRPVIAKPRVVIVRLWKRF